MRKILIFTLLALATLLTPLAYSQPPRPLLAQQHKDQGIGCKDCHGEGEKQAVETDQCLTCHESFEALAKRTKAFKPNPHDNHLVQGGAECTQCHSAHRASPLLCLQCHQGMVMEKGPKS